MFIYKLSMIIFFLLASVVSAHNRLYVHNCLQIANPYTSASSVEILMREVDTCLSRTYISFPENYRQEMQTKIQKCIDNIKETDRSKPEYHALEKLIAQLTSNVGSSIVDSQHSVSQLAVCAEPLKILTSVDVYEETRLEEIVDSFVHNIQNADVCIQNTMEIIDGQVIDIEEKLSNYKTTYQTWLNVTKQRREDAVACKLEMDTLIEEIVRHIVRELHS